MTSGRVMGLGKERERGDVWWSCGVGGGEGGTKGQKPP